MHHHLSYHTVYVLSINDTNITNINDYTLLYILLYTSFFIYTVPYIILHVYILHCNNTYDNFNTTAAKLPYLTSL